MAGHAISLSTAHGRSVAALQYRPPGTASACALLLHTLPGPGNTTLEILADQLVSQGWALTAVDAGLSAGAAQEPALDAADVESIVDTVAGQCGTPVVLLGHGYGGLLAIHATARSPSVRALALINVPAGIGGYAQRTDKGAGVLQVGTSQLVVPKSASTDLSWQNLEPKLEHLRRPLLFLHAPMDNDVDISNAARLFTAAKHPKSFISIDSGDHLLSRPAEGRHVAALIAAWAGRYLSTGDHETPHDSRVVVGNSITGNYRQYVAAGRHRLVADEPVAAGGDDAGSSPYELLLAALGACTAMTLRMYAARQKIPLDYVEVSLKHDKVHAGACQECDTKEGRIDRIERVVTLRGELDAPTRERLLEIANKCPVHRTLHSEVWVPTRLED